MFPRGFKFRMWAQFVAMVVMGAVCIALIVMFWPYPATIILGGFGLRSLWQDATALRAEIRQIRQQEAALFALTGRRA